MREERNLILITVDCLRADHLGCLGYSGQISPNIDTLAESGVLFSQAISNGANTPSSFPSIITSSYPSTHISGEKSGLPYDWLFLSEESISVAEVLKRNGYSTAAFNSNPWLSPFFGYNRGFDTFDEIFSRSIDQAVSVGRLDLTMRKSIANKILFHLHRGYTLAQILRGRQRKDDAHVINRKAIAWLRNHSSHFFIWLHYMDVHFPHIPSEMTLGERLSAIRLHNKIRRPNHELSPNDLRILTKFYDREIKYVDREIGSFLSKVESMGVTLDNTYTVLTADHGEQLGEHGAVGHGSLYDEVIRVPLIVCGPKIKQDALVQDQVELLDVSPTIIDLLKLQRIESFRGTSLLPLVRAEKSRKKRVITEVIFPLGRRNFSLRMEKLKYILSLDERGNRVSADLYDLEEDPNEKKNLISIRKEDAEKLETMLWKHISMEESYRQKSFKAKFNEARKEEILERLKSLGYI